MAERLRRMTDDELGAALSRLELSFPETTTDLAAMSVARLAEELAPKRGRSLTPRRWLAAILPPRGVRRALVLALLIVALSSIAVGATYFGVRGIQIVFDNGKPTPSASTTESPSPLPSPTLPGLGDRLELGDPTTLEAAEAAAGFDVLVPPDLPQFDEPKVFLITEPLVPRVSFVWVDGDEPKLLLTEFQADIYRPSIEKAVLAGGQVERVEVNGEPGFWFSGAAHELTYVDSIGIPFNDDTRLAGDTLIWTTGDVTFRLEGAQSLEQALQIARATTGSVNRARE